MDTLAEKAFIKQDFGYFKGIDKKTGKMVTSYHTEKAAEMTAKSYNKLRNASANEKRIQSLQSLEGY